MNEFPSGHRDVTFSVVAAADGVEISWFEVLGAHVNPPAALASSIPPEIVQLCQPAALTSVNDGPQATTCFSNL